jgi:hypothetical protein
MDRRVERSPDMREGGSRVVIVVHPGASRGRLGEVLRWIRWFVPTAVLLVGHVPPVEAGGDRVISLDVDEVASGPLSVADALARRWHDVRLGAEPEPMLPGVLARLGSA